MIPAKRGDRSAAGMAIAASQRSISSDRCFALEVLPCPAFFVTSRRAARPCRPCPGAPGAASRTQWSLARRRGSLSRGAARGAGLSARCACPCWDGGAPGKRGRSARTARHGAGAQGTAETQLQCLRAGRESGHVEHRSNRGQHDQVKITRFSSLDARHSSGLNDPPTAVF